MAFRTFAAAAAVVSLAATPAIAEANLDRGVAPVDGEAELGGESGASGVIIAILAAAAIIAGIIIAADNDDDEPISA